MTKKKDKSKQQSDKQGEDTHEASPKTDEQLESKQLNEPTRERLVEQVDKLNDDLKRSQADFVNLKRRTSEAQAYQATRIKADIVRNLLPVLDSLERAIDQKPEDLDDNDWATGIDGIVKQMQKALSEYGVTRINALNQEFDPNLHEAVTMDDSSKGKKEVVAEELQTGYKLNDSVVRPAMVKVKRQ
jgi:molecular chaperone GrpE